jgi:hypothetical protein
MPMPTLACSLLSTVLLAAAAAAPAPQAPPTAALGEEVSAVRRELLEAGRTRDRAAYERLLADGFTFVHGTGPIETRAEYIEQTVAGRQLFQRAEREVLDETVRHYPGPTAVVVSTVVMRSRTDGAETRLRGTNVYVKLPEGWRWAAGHSTRLPTRPPAATIDRATHYPRYAGTYRIAEGRTLTVTTEGVTLSAVVTGLRPGELVPRSATDFIWFNPENNVFFDLSFVLGEGGGARAAIGRREGVEVWRAERMP